MSVHGFLNVIKPVGLTSFAVVRSIRRMSGIRRVGHAGTLDPAAAGVLPICLGQATRLVEYLLDLPKVYCADIRFGAATDTYDATGAIVEKGDPSGVTLEAIEALVPSFTGHIKQQPPLFSALRVEGQRLYALARAGERRELPRRSVVVHHLEILDWSAPVLTLRIECGRGTYIRSLAHDLGKALGCGAFLQHLVRLCAGPFDFWSATCLTALEDAFAYGYWQRLVEPMDVALQSFPALVLSQVDAQRVTNGRGLELGQQSSLPVEDAHPLCRAYDQEGAFIAVLERQGSSGFWRPKKVFAAAGREL